MRRGRTTIKQKIPTTLMSKFVIDTAPLRISAAFRRIFIARTISIFGLGMLGVAIPVQIFELTGSTLQVGLAATLEGVAAFIGLLVGGETADRFDRKRLIITSRTLGAIAFAVLAVNAFSAEPQLWAIYALGAFDAFVGSLAVTALMAVTPTLVPREKLAAAGALNMLTVRLGTMVSPAVGGLVISGWGVGWNYTLAAAGTSLTVFLLLGLPALPAIDGNAGANPLRSAFQGAVFVYRHRVIRAVVAIGTLETVATGVRVVLPAVAVLVLGGGPAEAGLLFAAMPVGAVIGSLLSGWLAGLRHPGWWLMGLALGSFGALAGFGLARDLAGCLLFLGMFGLLNSWSGILQYALVQANTPDELLGRVNALWMAQETTGDSAGALLLGALGKILVPSGAVLIFAAGGAVAVLGTMAGCRSLRQHPRSPAPGKEPVST